MTTGALIDEIVKHWFGASTSDGNNADTEERILARLQEVADNIMADPTDWDFKHVLGGSVSMTSTGVADLPVDYGHQTKDDAVYVSGTQHEVTWMEPRALLRKLRLETGSSTYPDNYTIHGWNETTKRSTIYVLRPPSSTITLLVDYSKKAPTLVNTTGATNGLDYFPDDFHRAIVGRGAIKLLGLDGGDGRTPEFDLWLKQEISKRAVVRALGRNEIQRLGQNGGNHSYGMW